MPVGSKMNIAIPVSKNAKRNDSQKATGRFMEMKQLPAKVPSPPAPATSGDASTHRLEPKESSGKSLNDKTKHP